eukprot:5455297-Amphidinium_carterae.1
MSSAWGYGDYRLLVEPRNPVPVEEVVEFSLRGHRALFTQILMSLYVEFEINLAASHNLHLLVGYDSEVPLL